MRKIIFIGLVLLGLANQAFGMLPFDFKIQAARTSDEKELQEVLKIVNEEKGEATRRLQENLIENNQVYVVRGELHGIVSYAVVDTDPENQTATMRYFGVHPDFRGRGYAKELSYYVQRELERKKIKTLFMPLGKSEKAAKRLFEKDGFKIDHYEPRVSGDLLEPGPVLRKRVLNWKDENVITSFKRSSIDFLGLPAGHDTLHDFLGVSPYVTGEDLMLRFVGLAKEKNRRELGSEGYRMAFAVLFHDETREKYMAAPLNRRRNMGFVNVLYEEIPDELKRAYIFPEAGRDLERVRKYASVVGDENDHHDRLVELVDMAESAHQDLINRSLEKIKSAKSVYDIADLVEDQIGDVPNYRFIGEERVYEELERKLLDLAAQTRSIDGSLNLLRGLLQVDSALMGEDRFSKDWFENVIETMPLPLRVHQKLELLKNLLDMHDLSDSARGTLFGRVMLNEMEKYLNKKGSLQEMAHLLDLKEQYSIQLDSLMETEKVLIDLTEPVEQSMRYPPQHVRRELINKMREQRGGQMIEFLKMKSIEFSIAAMGLVVMKGTHDLFPFLTGNYYRYVNGPIDVAWNAIKPVIPGMVSILSAAVAIRATLDTFLDSWPSHNELKRWDAYREHRDRKRALQTVLEAEKCNFETLGD